MKLNDAQVAELDALLEPFMTPLADSAQPILRMAAMLAMEHGWDRGRGEQAKVSYEQGKLAGELALERDAYRTYAGSMLDGLFEYGSIDPDDQESIALATAMIEPYIVSDEDGREPPDGCEPGDTAYRFTKLGQAAIRKRVGGST